MNAKNIRFCLLAGLVALLCLAIGCGYDGDKPRPTATYIAVSSLLRDRTSPVNTDRAAQTRELSAQSHGSRTAAADGVRERLPTAPATGGDPRHVSACVADAGVSAYTGTPGDVHALSVSAYDIGPQWKTRCVDALSARSWTVPFAWSYWD